MEIYIYIHDIYIYIYMIYIYTFIIYIYVYIIYASNINIIYNIYTYIYIYILYINTLSQRNDKLKGKHISPESRPCDLALKKCERMDVLHHLFGGLTLISVQIVQNSVLPYGCFTP